MNYWTPRKINGATLACMGLFALLAQPIVTQALSSLILKGLAQASLAGFGAGALIIGLYRIATPDKTK